MSEPRRPLDQQVALDAISAAYDRYFADVLGSADAGARLRSVARRPISLNGAVVIGQPDRTDPRLQDLIDEELASRTAG